MKYLIVSVLAVSIFLSTSTLGLSGGCTAMQQDQAKTVLASMVNLGEREVVGSGVWYVWKSNWYAMGPDAQERVMRMVADAEFCAHNGRYTHMHIEYNGHEVAKATPQGGIQVLRSTP